MLKGKRLLFFLAIVVLLAVAVEEISCAEDFFAAIFGCGGRNKCRQKTPDRFYPKVPISKPQNFYRGGIQKTPRGDWIRQKSRYDSSSSRSPSRSYSRSSSRKTPSFYRSDSGESSRSPSPVQTYSYQAKAACGKYDTRTSCSYGDFSGQAYHKHELSAGVGASARFSDTSANLQVRGKAGFSSHSGAGAQYGKYVGGDVEVKTFAGVKGKAGIDVGTSGMRAYAGGFAGASVGGKASVHAGGVGLVATGKLQAGIGGGVGLLARLDSQDNVEVGVDCGACVGFGASAGLAVKINPKKVARDCNNLCGLGSR